MKVHHHERRKLQSLKDVILAQEDDLTNKYDKIGINSAKTTVNTFLQKIPQSASAAAKTDF